MIDIKEYTKPDGRTDWKAYENAKKACGEACNRCGSYIIFPKGYRTTCGPCQSLTTERGELWRNEKGIRCPSCGFASSDPYDYDNDMFQEGTHEFTCQRCDHEFEVETHVDYSWTSPPMIDKKIDDDEEEEQDDVDDQDE